jgi:ParB-like chromosome segregation protein Spo0J
VIPNDPVSSVQWVPIEWVVANDYNPNSVARNEMNLLYISIKHDGYTQPIVTVIDHSCVIHFPCKHKLEVKDGAHPVWKLVKPLNNSSDRTTTVKGIKCPKCKRTPARMQVEDASCAVIVDGFHRYQVCKTHKDISEPRGNQVPIVIINKSINDRMASTVRHNRARGRHATTGMASMVFAMLEKGWTDEEVCNQIGLEAEELLRLKHITGFSKLFESTTYQNAWETERMIRLRQQYSERPSSKSK